MITVGMNYEVLEGKDEIFIKAFNSVIEALKAAPGHTSSKLYRDTNSANSFLIISEWNDKDAFDGFIRSEEFAKVTNWGKEQILSGRPLHRIY